MICSTNVIPEQVLAIVDVIIIIMCPADARKDVETVTKSPLAHGAGTTHENKSLG